MRLRFIEKAASKGVHISDEVDLDMMEEDGGNEDNLMYWKACRCGSRFEITEKDLELGNDVVICEVRRGCVDVIPLQAMTLSGLFSGNPHPL